MAKYKLIIELKNVRNWGNKRDLVKEVEWFISEIEKEICEINEEEKVSLITFTWDIIIIIIIIINYG